MYSQIWKIQQFIILCADLPFVPAGPVIPVLPLLPLAPGSPVAPVDPAMPWSPVIPMEDEICYTYMRICFIGNFSSPSASPT